MNIEDMLAAEGRRLTKTIQRFFLSKCESPIEQMMMLALLRMWQTEWFWPEYWGNMEMADSAPNEDPFAIIGDDRLWCDAERCPAYIYCQHPAGKYRLDFALLAGSQKIAIEVDGHDFHERTKEQAAHDKARDRALVTAGWKVLRFTGSEVWRDPYECARQVELLLFAEIERWELAHAPAHAS